MPTDPSDPSTPKPSTRLYQTTSDASSGSGGVFLVILLLLFLGGGAAYYFLLYQPAASAGATVLAPPTASGTPKPVVAATPPPATPANPTYTNDQRVQYIKQADDAFATLREAKGGAFTVAFNAFLSAGGLQGAGLVSKAEIAARRDLLTQSQTANDDYETFIKTQEATYKAELQKTPLKPDDMDYVLSDANYRLQTEKNLQLRGLQRDLLKTADAMLAYLDKSYGNWSINAAHNLAFKKPADAAPFTALGKTYNDQLAALNKLQAEIKAATAPASTPPASPAAPTSPAVSPAASPAVSASPVASPAATAATSPAASPAASATP